MNRRIHQPLLLPANPKFIWGSIVCAGLLQMCLSFFFGRTGYWLPDILAVVVVFWCIHQPRRIGIGVAFFAGLFTDLYQFGLLGQHALGYVALAYMAYLVHRRIMWFTSFIQAVNLFFGFALVCVLYVVVRMLDGGLFPGWMVFIAPVLEALLWPVVCFILLMPQRQPPDPDEHRPI